MTILSSNQVPIGLQGLSLFLIGVGTVYLIAYFGMLMYTFQALDGNYFGFDSSNLTYYLTLEVVAYLVPGIFSLSASAALFFKKKFAKILLISYGITALVGLGGIVSGHPSFLFGIMGAITLYYMWQPHVREYFRHI